MRITNGVAAPAGGIRLHNFIVMRAGVGARAEGRLRGRCRRGRCGAGRKYCARQEENRCEHSRGEAELGRLLKGESHV